MEGPALLFKKQRWSPRGGYTKRQRAARGKNRQRGKSKRSHQTFGEGRGHNARLDDTFTVRILECTTRGKSDVAFVVEHVGGSLARLGKKIGEQ